MTEIISWAIPITSIALMAGGFVAEVFGVLAMICWPVRRRLPDPFALASAGAAAFILGGAVARVGALALGVFS